MRYNTKRLLLSASFLTISCGSLIAMEQKKGPMNAEWFYAHNNPYKTANDLHQERRWKEAATDYEQKLRNKIGTEYDQEMAQLNLAACLMAQQQPTEHWGSFDALIGIDEEQRLSQEKVDLLAKNGKKSILVRTDQVGIGDIAHFLQTTRELKKRCKDCQVTVSVRPFLKNTISNVVKGYGCDVISEKDAQPKTDYTTHIIGLLGHLKMNPAQTKPEIILDAPDRAMKVVNEQVKAVLDQGKTVAVVFAGEDRQATLIGGKQLPRNKEAHGRQISPAAFSLLLKKNPNLVLLDCGTKDSRVTVDENQKHQYMVIPNEEQPFDTVVALARIMSVNKKIIALAADQGPSNVFARSLDSQAQKRMAFIIPNAKEYDVRMEGKNTEYQQMISDCLVLKSNSAKLEDQVAVLEKALQKTTTGK
jgi:hypothetical protein